MVAAFIVEDTPERQMKGKKRSNTQTQRTPPSDSRRKRRAQGRSPLPIPVSAIHPDEDIAESKQEFDDRKTEIDHVGKTENLSGSRCDVEENLNPSKTSDAPAIPCIDRLREERKQEIDQVEKMENSLGNRGNVEVNLNPSNITDAPAIPCIDKLREELSCAICLEICYEPSTTPCGHSFCRKCLLSAADKCGRKCPKCRNLISNGRYSTVNTVLWNTIQLLFPQEVEARKATSPASDSNEKVASPARITRRNRFVASLGSPGSERNDEERGIHRRIRRQTAVAMRSRIRTGFPDQDEDAALAFRLQREEFLEAFRERGNSEHRASTRVSRRA